MFDRRLMKTWKLMVSLLVLLECFLFITVTSRPRFPAWSPQGDAVKKKQRGTAKPVTIPVGIKVKGVKPEPELQLLDLNVSEDGEPESILSIRAIGSTS